jgi:hypothetical protein
MARIGISLTKSVSYRNSTQEFSNVYYYTSSSPLPTENEADAMIDQLVAIEKAFHSTSVSYVRARCWSQGGSPGTNDMILQKNLAGTGSTTADNTMDRERAFLASIRAGVDSRGKPVYLRKWYHSCGTGPGSVAASTTIIAQTTGFTTTQRNAVGNAVSNISPIGTGGEVWTICAKSGREPSASFAWQGHSFLEHHQLGDQWRRQ